MSDAGVALDEKIVGLWFLSTTETSDWLAVVRELEPDTRYELIYRFQYYKDDKAFNSKDEKNWYQGTVSGTRNFVIAAIRSAGELMAMGTPHTLYELINDKGVDDFMLRLQDMPFATVRVGPAPS